jgi:hypothetical protein
VDADCLQLNDGSTCQDGFCKKSPLGAPDSGSACSGGACTPDSGERAPIIGGLRGIAATDAGWIAVGYEATLQAPPENSRFLAFTSSDAQTWQRVDLPGEAGALHDIAFGGGTIVALGSGTRLAQILTKPAGGEWQYQWTRGGTIESVLYGNGVFFTSGFESGASVSTDGLNWNGTSARGKVAFAENKFIEFAYDTGTDEFSVRTSTDGSAWTPPTPYPSSVGHIVSFTSVGDQQFGHSAAHCPGDCNPVRYRALNGPLGAPLSALQVTELGTDPNTPTQIASDSARVAVFSETTVRVTAIPLGSTNWSNVSLGARGWRVHDVAVSGDTLVAVGEVGPVEVLREQSPFIATSKDGVTWTWVDFPGAPAVPAVPSSPDSCRSDPDCSDNDFCNGAETCAVVSAEGGTVRKCTAGTPMDDGTACGQTNICLTRSGNANCVQSTCGDGFTDHAANEECDPPNTTGCDSACRGIVP